MKKTILNISLAGLLVSGFSVGFCQQPSVPTPRAQSQQKRTKKVEVSIMLIKGVKPTFSGGASTSFPVGPKSKPTVTVYWNGYGFICKDDSGRTFWRYSNDLAFGKRQTAQFVVVRKVTITDKDGSTGMSTSDTVEVKRGVPSTLFPPHSQQRKALTSVQ